MILELSNTTLNEKVALNTLFTSPPQVEIQVNVDECFKRILNSEVFLPLLLFLDITTLCLAHGALLIFNV